MTWLFSKALIDSCESLPSSPVRGGASSAASCSDGEPCAPLNVMPTQRPFWRNDKTMDVLSRSPFGLTWKPLTADRGEELLTLFRAAFPARTYPQPEKAQASKENEAASGASSLASFARWHPDSCSWKTAQCSLLGGLESFSETWPRWGSMRNGVCWERAPLAPLIEESESGLSVPTPCAWDAQRNGSKNTQNLYRTKSGTVRRVNSSGQSSNCGLVEMVQHWPTPTACMSKGTSPASLARKDGKSRANDRLDHAVLAKQMFPTPRANDGEKRGDFNVMNPRNGLPAAVKRWPTPLATDGKHGGPNQKGGKGDLRLSAAVNQQSTDQPTGQLNPTWVEWLMGWNLGWTDLKPLETDKSRNAPPKRSANSTRG